MVRFVGFCLARPRLGSMVAFGALLLLFMSWVMLPAVALGYHDTPTNTPHECDLTDGWEDRCECMYHAKELVRQQLIAASPDPGPGPAYLSAYKSRDDIKSNTAGTASVAWWRVESVEETCARMDMMEATRGITRFLAGSVTGLVGMSFVWCVVQLMQESVSGGRVVEARNNLFRTLVGLMIFGFTWVIYESFTVGLFGVKQFTAGSFVGLTGHFGY